MRDRHPVAGIADGVCKQPREWHPPSEHLARPGACGTPAGYRAGHGVSRQAAPKRNRGQARLAIALDAGGACRRTACLQASGRLVRPSDQPEAVAPDTVHVRVGHGDGCCCSDHRFNRVTALSQDS